MDCTRIKDQGPGFPRLPVYFLQSIRGWVAWGMRLLWDFQYHKKENIVLQQVRGWVAWVGRGIWGRLLGKTASVSSPSCCSCTQPQPPKPDKSTGIFFTTKQNNDRPTFLSNSNLRPTLAFNSVHQFWSRPLNQPQCSEYASLYVGWERLPEPYKHTYKVQAMLPSFPKLGGFDLAICFVKVSKFPIPIQLEGWGLCENIFRKQEYDSTCVHPTTWKVVHEKFSRLLQFQSF